MCNCVFTQYGKPPQKPHWSVSEKKKSGSRGSVRDSIKSSEMQKLSVEKSATVSPGSLMWVDNYKPTNLQQIIGQQGDKSGARKLYVWLSNWRDNYWKKPVCM